MTDLLSSFLAWAFVVLWYALGISGLLWCILGGRHTDSEDKRPRAHQ